ncbi:MAG TPA: hypothetical protein VGK13_07975 [Methanocellaceae archaeon]
MEAVPEAPVAKKEISLVGKIVLILLMGGLSMFFAEVLSGSSVLWFLQPWGWLVTLPLYMFHTLLLLNLALIFKRRSLSSLYLWGVIFGLYEAWITKVVWAGYMGQAPAVGTFMGFAIFEAPLIVLFWHPVMSFILPILTFQVLSGEKSLLPGHIQILGKNRTNWAIFLFIMIIGASSLAMNSKYSIISTVLTLVGSIIFILLFYWIATKKYAPQFSIRSLRLGKVGLAITILYMFVLYFGAFFYLLPERTPKWPTLLLTLCVYALIIALLWLKKPDTEAEAQTGTVFNIKDAGILFGILLVLGIVFCLVPSVSYILELCLYILIFTLGPLLFGYAVVRVLKERFVKPAVH